MTSNRPAAGGGPRRRRRVTAVPAHSLPWMHPTASTVRPGRRPSRSTTRISRPRTEWATTGVGGAARTGAGTRVIMPRATALCGTPAAWILARVSYNLDALGWLQFERLCDHALELCCGVDRALWTGSADDVRSVVLEDALELPAGAG